MPHRAYRRLLCESRGQVHANTQPRRCLFLTWLNHSSADVTGNTELANLRCIRSRCHFRLEQAEGLAQSYRDKEARTRAIAPELELPARLRTPFARTELTRLALAILREANEPLPIRAWPFGRRRQRGLCGPIWHYSGGPGLSCERRSGSCVWIGTEVVPHCWATSTH
jgi:hypothetical protein